MKWVLLGGVAYLVYRYWSDENARTYVDKVTRGIRGVTVAGIDAAGAKDERPSETVPSRYGAGATKTDGLAGGHGTSPRQIGTGNAGGGLLP